MAGTPETTIRRLKRLQKTYNRGMHLFDQGDDSHELFVLLVGEVSVIRDGEQIATISKPNTFIGEISALMKTPRTATCISMRASTLLCIPGDKLEDFFDTAPGIGFKLATILAERLDNMNQKYMKLLNKDEIDDDYY